MESILEFDSGTRFRQRFRLQCNFLVCVNSRGDVVERWPALGRPRYVLVLVREGGGKVELLPGIVCKVIQLLTRLPIAFGPMHWGLLVALPVGVSLVAMVTAKLTVMRTLERML